MLTFYEESEIPISKQSFPGTDHEMPAPKPTRDELPDPHADGGRMTYLAAGKLKGKKALITGGDSGIGAATALLFAREGADSTIAYLAEEEKDAQETKRQVEKEGAKCHLVAVDLTKQQDCQKIVDFAIEKMGAIDILFNNAACRSNTLSVCYMCVKDGHLTLDRSNGGRGYQGSQGGAVGAYIQHQHPPCFLRLQIRSSTHEVWFNHHQQRFHQCLHWPS